MAEVHQQQGAAANYPLDEEEDDEEEDEEEEGDEDDLEEDEEEELDLEERLEKKEDPDFDEMIGEQIQAGNIKLKVGRSTKWVMRCIQVGNILKSFFSCRHCRRLKIVWLPIEGEGVLLVGCTQRRTTMMMKRKEQVRLCKRVIWLTLFTWRSSG